MEYKGFLVGSSLFFILIIVLGAVPWKLNDVASLSSAAVWVNVYTVDATFLFNRKGLGANYTTCSSGDSLLVNFTKAICDPLKITSAADMSFRTVNITDKGAHTLSFKVSGKIRYSFSRNFTIEEVYGRLNPAFYNGTKLENGTSVLVPKKPTPFGMGPPSNR